MPRSFYCVALDADRAYRHGLRDTPPSRAFVVFATPMTAPRRRLLAALAATAVLVAGARAHATTLLAAVAGARDSALAGSTVAAPTDLMTGFFQNPAGLTLLDRPQATLGTGFIIAQTEVRTSFGYEGDSDIVALAPSAGAATVRGRWRFGVGMFGSVGTKFDFPADPQHGVARNFYTELAAITIAPTAAYEVTRELAVGVQINPLFGTLKNRVPTPEQQLRWKVQGPGIQGVIGVLYSPTPAWRFAVTYKTPGAIFLRGTVGVAGKREDLQFTFHVPQQVIVGAAWRPAPPLLLTAFGAWIDTSAFERSQFEFSDTPALDFPFARESNDVFRFGAGIEYEAPRHVTLRTGVARGEAALRPRSVSPLVYDANSVIVGAGIGVDLGRWTVDITGGIGLFDDRKINANEAPVFPGRFTTAGPVTYLQLTRRF